MNNLAETYEVFQELDEFIKDKKKEIATERNSSVPVVSVVVEDIKESLEYLTEHLYHSSNADIFEQAMVLARRNMCFLKKADVLRLSNPNRKQDYQQVGFKLFDYRMGYWKELKRLMEKRAKTTLSNRACLSLIIITAANYCRRKEEIKKTGDSSVFVGSYGTGEGERWKDQFRIEKREGISKRGKQMMVKIRGYYIESAEIIGDSIGLMLRAHGNARIILEYAIKTSESILETITPQIVLEAKRRYKRNEVREAYCSTLCATSLTMNYIKKIKKYVRKNMKVKLSNAQAVKIALQIVRENIERKKI